MPRIAALGAFLLAPVWALRGAQPNQPKAPRTVQVLFAGMRVQGSSEFVTRTCAALKLLKPTPYLARVRRDITLIKEGERSGARPYDRIPSYEVGKRTWQAAPVWYASTIVHDAYHAHLYKVSKGKDGSVPDSAWTGAGAERTCLKVQLDALRALHADRHTVEYVRGLLKNPTYQGNASSWSDYKKRNW